jgi:hypothetical protein
VAHQNFDAMLFDKLADMRWCQRTAALPLAVDLLDDSDALVASKHCHPSPGPSSFEKPEARFLTRLTSEEFVANICFVMTPVFPFVE